MVVRIKQQPGTTTSSASGSVVYADNAWDAFQTTQTRWSGAGSAYPAGAALTKGGVMASFAARAWKYLDNRWKNDFSVLKMKVMKVSKESGINAEKKFFKMNLRIMKPAFWTDDNNPQDGHIQVYWFCDNPFQDPNYAVANGVPNAPAVSGVRPHLGLSWRLTYTDL